MNIPRRRWSQRPPPNNDPVYLTPEGVERLRARLERLKASLPAAIDEAARTGAFGDRSDNAEYKEAKSILRRTKGQILNLEDQLKRVVEIPSGADMTGAVRLGTTVRLRATNGAVTTYRIVGPSETDPGHGRISHISPLGAALVGHRVGDPIVVKSPKGTQEYSIIDVA
ncbi:MAG TPA: GreA/GreB family elongation factor [Candidatus Paceibacterota bacterium]|nr:GreA/GreB family elongation factor [Candidatus Paceibacterota bacterium]